MFTHHKKKLILSSLLILLPILFGLLLWNDLPAVMTTHWGADGVADGFTGKIFAVFVPPLLLLAGHWFCLWWTLRDPKNDPQSPKALGMIFWILPVVSLFTNGITYSVALGNDLSILNMTPALLGLVFVFIGNYMPKYRQNRSLGIKVPWTFHTEENWNRTHRFGGKVWVFGGLAMVFAVLLPLEIGTIVTVAAMMILSFAPILYSYLLYRKQVRNHEIPAIAPGQFRSNKLGGISVLLILVFVAVIMFTGSIDIAIGESSMVIDATFWHSLEVEYDAIDSIEYRTDLATGIRTSGFGSARLQMGLFTNGELGSYTRYGYVKATDSIHILCDDAHLVIALQTSEATQALYETLLTKVK